MDFNSFGFFIFIGISLALTRKLLNDRLYKISLSLLSLVFFSSFDIKTVPIFIFVAVISFLSPFWIKRFKKPLLPTIASSLVILLPLIGFKLIKSNFFLSLEETHWAHFLYTIGLSFYTLQAIGYVVDASKDRIETEKSFLNYFLFLSFFPQVLSGPIMRYKRMAIYNLKNKKLISYSAFISIIFWALIKKILLADQLSSLSAPIFSAPESFDFSARIFAIYCYALQLYFDFSAYSEIAVATAAIFGIHLVQNFKHPYLSTNIQIFWRTWHVSLSSWLKDYIYIPLGGKRIRWSSGCVILTFLAGAIWHGLGELFLLWGLYNSLLLIAFKKGRRVWEKFGNRKSLNILFNFHLMAFGFLFIKLSNLAAFFEFITPSQESATISVAMMILIVSLGLLVCFSEPIIKRTLYKIRHSHIKTAGALFLIVIFLIINQQTHTGFLYHAF